MLHKLPQNPVFGRAHLDLPEPDDVLFRELLALLYQRENPVGELVAELGLELYYALDMRFELP